MSRKLEVFLKEVDISVGTTAAPGSTKLEQVSGLTLQKYLMLVLS